MDDYGAKDMHHGDLSEEAERALWSDGCLGSEPVYADPCPTSARSYGVFIRAA